MAASGAPAWLLWPWASCRAHRPAPAPPPFSGRTTSWASARAAPGEGGLPSAEAAAAPRATCRRSSGSQCRTRSSSRSLRRSASAMRRAAVLPRRRRLCYWAREAPQPRRGTAARVTSGNGLAHRSSMAVFGSLAPTMMMTTSAPTTKMTTIAASTAKHLFDWTVEITGSETRPDAPIASSVSAVVFLPFSHSSLLSSCHRPPNQVDDALAIRAVAFFWSFVSACRQLSSCPGCWPRARGPLSSRVQRLQKSNDSESTHGKYFHGHIICW